MFQFPPSPSVGQLFTPAPGINYRWNGTAWFPVGAASGGIKISDTEPVITTGEQWYESDTAGHYMRYQNPDGTSTLVSLAGAGGDFIPTAASTTIVPESRIINGGFAIDQRNAGATVTANAANTTAWGPDRWAAQVVGGTPAVLTIQRAADSPRNGEYMLFAAVTTPDPTLAGSDFYLLEHKIEGFSVADFNSGQVAAKPFTFAFELNSTVAGTLAVSFRAGSRAYVTTFTVPANSIATYSVTVPGDPTNVWNRTNGLGLMVDFCLGAAASLTAPASNTWVTGNFVSAPGCTNFMASAGTQIHIGSVRLYPGSIDYGPCRRLYAEELRLCQRYYCKSYNIDVVPGAAVFEGRTGWVRPGSAAIGDYLTPIAFPVSMRANPTVTGYTAETGAANAWIGPASSTVPTASTGTGQSGTYIYNNVAVTPAGFFGGHWTANAEL